jgi:hypothetical protein
LACSSSEKYPFGAQEAAESGSQTSEEAETVQELLDEIDAVQDQLREEALEKKTD